MKAAFERLSFTHSERRGFGSAATEPLIDTQCYLEACDLPRGSSAGFT